MNQRALKLRRKKTWCKYHIPGGGNLQRLKKNVVFLSTANSLEHELAKTHVCYLLKKLGHEFVTEGECSINKVKYRRDIVDLDSGIIYEVETSPERAKRFQEDPETSNIKVIKLFEKEKIDIGDI